MKTKIFILLLVLFSYLKQNEVYGQSAILTNMEKTQIWKAEQKVLYPMIKVTCSTFDNVDKVFFGIGNKEGSLDISSHSAEIVKYEGKIFQYTSPDYLEIKGNDLFLIIPLQAADLTNAFLTVYLVNKDGSFSNKLSIPAK